VSAGNRREPVISVLEPAEGVLAFYAGRDGSRFAPEPNWVDAGAISLGLASYALIVGADALVYDTGISPAWGAFVLAELQRRGAERIRVVLSHHHLDHIAGTAPFGDVEVIANARTGDLPARAAQPYLQRPRHPADRDRRAGRLGPAAHLRYPQ
jgi:glyoxylase-like metal-dependent hydrolase (beta-lactamase superfamily II)